MHLAHCGELEPVGAHETLVAVGPRDEVLTETGAPLRRVLRDVADRLKAEFLRVVAADEDRERVIEAEGLEPCDMKTRGVLALDAAEDLVRIRERRQLEDSRQRRAGVFDVRVDLARDERVVREIAPEVEAPLDRQARARFDRLRHDLAQNDLLGEILRADRNAPRGAGMESEDGNDGGGSDNGAEHDIRVTAVQATRTAAETVLDSAEKEIRRER